MVIGTMGTRHFDFMFVAKTEKAVIKEAKEAWKRHCEVYVDADPDYFGDDIESEISFFTVDKMPVSFRDGDEI